VTSEAPFVRVTCDVAYQIGFLLLWRGLDVVLDVVKQISFLLPWCYLRDLNRPRVSTPVMVHPPCRGVVRYL
jgi:hypothetical protein